MRMGHKRKSENRPSACILSIELSTCRRFTLLSEILALIDANMRNLGQSPHIPPSLRLTVGDLLSLKRPTHDLCCPDTVYEYIHAVAHLEKFRRIARLLPSVLIQPLAKELKSSVAPGYD